MDGELIQRTIDDLREHLKYVENSLEILEGMPYGDRRNKRGRKSMGAAERLEVSERMRKYWGWQAKRHILKRIRSTMLTVRLSANPSHLPRCGW